MAPLPGMPFSRTWAEGDLDSRYKAKKWLAYHVIGADSVGRYK